MPQPLRRDDPRQAGPYPLTGLLGEGGQGAVYLGHDASGAPVAVKILHARLARDEESRRRFLREVDAARRVGPFSTARVLAVDIEGDRPYIVSEFVDGESLQQLITRDGPRDEGGLRRLALATAAALRAIHQAGIVHRDFKPSNVLLGPDGPRVIDFGIARALESTTLASSGVVGTPTYMSPEQVAGQRVGPASDVFSWGIAMAFAATGTPAFGQDSIPAVLNRILNHEPDLTGLPGDMRDLVASCLAKDPDDRPSADDLLHTILGHAPPAGPRRLRRRARLRRRRRCGPAPSRVRSPRPRPPIRAARWARPRRRVIARSSSRSWRRSRPAC
ncbi:serine/threonine-protein kinase [Thermocatellispora tengchongensis]|uniref:serine/threonine-protein kinase n=1 Tax=Thermocatellispora tengchongensis TaxID=1073253 RepID=UPI00364048B1